jgi:pimeloyl-ACP methyl ester carboxylesterase
MTHTAKVNGIQLGYVDRGEGEPLVLLHGGFGTVETFGPNLELLGQGRRLIGVDLQSHGRSPVADRPMRAESMADDVAALIEALGLERAAVMGFSLGGQVALRTAIQHPGAVSRLVLVSTPFRRSGWFPEQTAAMDAMGPEMADLLRPTPLYEAYEAVAPDPAGWPTLVEQVTTAVKEDYDWTAEARGLQMPVMLVAGDADGLPPSYVAECFALLGGGLRDADWDGSGRPAGRLAIMPGTTHYDIFASPALAAPVLEFLAAPTPGL